MSDDYDESFDIIKTCCMSLEVNLKIRNLLSAFILLPV